jgi:hypothetical protein
MKTSIIGGCAGVRGAKAERREQRCKLDAGRVFGAGWRDLAAMRRLKDGIVVQKGAISVDVWRDT